MSAMHHRLLEELVDERVRTAADVVTLQAFAAELDQSIEHTMQDAGIPPAERAPLARRLIADTLRRFAAAAEADAPTDPDAHHTGIDPASSSDPSPPGQLTEQIALLEHAAERT